MSLVALLLISLIATSVSIIKFRKEEDLEWLVEWHGEDIEEMWIMLVPLVKNKWR